MNSRNNNDNSNGHHQNGYYEIDEENFTSFIKMKKIHRPWAKEKTRKKNKLIIRGRKSNDDRL